MITDRMIKTGLHQGAMDLVVQTTTQTVTMVTGDLPRLQIEISVQRVSPLYFAFLCIDFIPEKCI